MFVHLTNSIAAEVLYCEPLLLQPRWELSGRSLIVGSYYSGQEHEHHVVTETVGSGSWYKPEFNELRFGKNDLVLKSFWLPIPEENMDLESLIEQWTAQEPLVGLLRLASPEGFSPEQADFRWFDPQGQMLVCVNKSAFSDVESKTLLRCAVNVDLMFANSQLCGWILYQPLNFVTYGWKNSHPLESEDSVLTAATHEYLQITSDPFIEQMEGEDPSVLKVLLNLREKLKEKSIAGYQRKVLIGSIESVIENFYGEMAA